MHRELMVGVLNDPEFPYTGAMEERVKYLVDMAKRLEEKQASFSIILSMDLSHATSFPPDLTNPILVTTFSEYKQQEWEALASMATQWKPEWIIEVMSCWAATESKDPELAKLAPRDRPDHKEIILAQVHTLTGTVSYICTKNSDGTFTELEKKDGMTTSRLAAAIAPPMGLPVSTMVH